ncbi:hypothetical protein ORIO_02240 [Cereibacter azotoformans]|uniref:Uncharacterized protein n=1 Tax=Cereibacter sphaeroides (strain ATCC 17025 / ATH 2.4.3) TaxID=349102 RepID=A4WPP0_CERS5|nr:hypothetical protein [Cereibacter azotoformans]ULB08756.1 hypothetical protein ORIO_02240 [Cereibacter azotoformans]
MKLIGNWRKVLSSAWSVWLMGGVVVLSGLETAAAFFSPDSLDVSPALYSAGTGLLAAAAILARVLFQQSLAKPEEDETDGA